MSFHSDPSPLRITVEKGQEELRFEDDATRITETHLSIKERLENHEGRLMGLQQALSVLQSALNSGFATWLTVIGVLAAALLVLGGWNLVQMRADTENVRSDVRDVRGEMRDVRSEVRDVSIQIRDLDEKVDDLPEEIAREQRARR